ncbi:MAG TPA: PQQ-binding-like beta-propeller repeat protein, partial [Ktedonobacterales bacterium]|nr:PQQ-binding-like beta-propeller repeat protein [Ktedonobacterales bacterium]
MTILQSQPISVFISYSRADAARIDRLEAYLIGYGFQPWVDRSQLEGGQQWATHIEQAIQECAVVVVGLSPEAAISPWVTDELLYARQLGKPIIPVLLQPVASIPLVLVAFQYIDMRQEDDQSLQQLRQRLLVVGRQSGTAPSRPERPTTRRIASTPQEHASDPDEALVPLPDPSPVPDLNGLFTQGISAWGNGDLDLAEAILRQVVERDPAFGNGEAARALKEVRHFLLPIQIKRLRTRAQDAERRGAWNEAIEAWQALQKQTPLHQLFLGAEARRRLKIDRKNQGETPLYTNVRDMLARGDVKGARAMWLRLKKRAPRYGDPDHLYKRLKPRPSLRRRMSTVLAIALIPALIAGAFAVLKVIYPPGNLIWKFDTSGAVGSSPAVANGMVYIGSNDGSLYALDASTGSLMWEYQTGDVVHSSPTVANGMVYVGSNNSNVYALDTTTGSLVWKYQTGDIIDSSPTVANGTVYVGSNDGNLYALDASTGSLAWEYQTTGKIHSSPIVADGMVYFGSYDDDVYALDASTGSLAWDYQTGNVIDDSPTVANGTVYIGSDDGAVYALNANTGSLVWT